MKEIRPVSKLGWTPTLRYGPPRRELCDVALTRFAAGELGVNLEFVLRWQEQIRSLGYDYVSPLIATFSRQHDGLPDISALP